MTDCIVNLLEIGFLILPIAIIVGALFNNYYINQKEGQDDE